MTDFRNLVLKTSPHMLKPKTVSNQQKCDHPYNIRRANSQGSFRIHSHLQVLHSNSKIFSIIKPWTYYVLPKRIDHNINGINSKKVLKTPTKIMEWKFPAKKHSLDSQKDLRKQFLSPLNARFLKQNSNQSKSAVQKLNYRAGQRHERFLKNIKTSFGRRVSKDKKQVRLKL